jgi:integrating conjugative element protein (TIGR03756 family)
MMNKFIFTFILLFLSCQTFAAGITSVDITAATLKGLANPESCLKYHVEPAVCVWLSPEGAQTFTPYIEQHIPDLIVSVYRNEDENPWFEARKLLDAMPGNVRQKLVPMIGSGDSPLNKVGDNGVIFKEADVIGNPAVSMFMQHIPYASLKTTARPMMPYYLSIVDTMAWRGTSLLSKPEETYSIGADFIHRVGTGFTNWGGVYPHQGFVLGTDDAIASMVIAERAADLVTTSIPFDHVHQILPEDCGFKCRASPIKENSDETLFQRIYPDKQNSCEIFGSDASDSDGIYNQDKQYDGSYAWIVWRKYEGCVQGDGVFIGVMKR